MAKSDRVTFTCNGAPVDVEIHPDESLLSVLRERLGIISVKDGCAPQGQCGCCTVLVDGSPRVACVTAASRVEGRTITTIEGVDPSIRSQLVDAFVATGASQCGFCTPGILVRATGLLGNGRTDRAAVDRALAAHLCRCTGWCTIREAINAAATAMPMDASARRDLDAAARRAELEGGVAQRVGADVPIGDGGFADDTGPRDALVAVPAICSDAPTTDAAGLSWVIADTLDAARAQAGKVQGRRTTVEPAPPLTSAPCPDGGVRLATGWLEPAYLEPDASWCAPGGEPASPLANGGAFGGKETSVVATAARELADQFGRPVRTVLAREDVVRLGPKRPPIAATAVLRDGRVDINGTVAGALERFTAPLALAYRLDLTESWTEQIAPGPPVGAHARATGLAERTILVEGAIDAAGVARADLVTDDRLANVLLDACALVDGGAAAGARVHVDPNTGALQRVDVRVAAGDPLDEVVLRSYAIGGAHMALGWVLSEGLTVDPATGEVLDLTIRSFGVLRAKDTPPIEITIVDDPAPARPRSSDAVFAAVAAATWNAITTAEGERPESFPARGVRAARRLRT
ncbi:MAG: 2Fe-2S iron-sulfur cluster binding domain-containing protein [Actinobacteria bacterium]|nr:2Fe-2S iron-sulfur cluster binding domain-containing protein [Actinomycetota bacterium]